MRSGGGRSMNTITATPRQLESLICLAQALAKMRLSEIGKVFCMFYVINAWFKIQPPALLLHLVLEPTNFLKIMSNVYFCQ